jgi:hypothetical protein
MFIFRVSFRIRRRVMVRVIVSIMPKSSVSVRVSLIGNNSVQYCSSEEQEIPKTKPCMLES